MGDVSRRSDNAGVDGMGVCVCVWATLWGMWMWVEDIWNGEERERDVEFEGASLAVMYAASAAQKLYGCKNGSFGTACIYSRSAAG